MVPFKWVGGKRRLVPLLLSLLPAHVTYVEVFGGAAALLLAKPVSSLEVYNDLDQGVVHFFRMLRDPEYGLELQRRLVLTPYARTEYAWCRTTWAEVTDPVEKARRWYVVARQSFGGNFAHAWGRSLHGDKAEPQAFAHAVAGLWRVAERFHGVQVEGDDFRTLISRYDSPTTLFYCDPPYLPETWTGGGYQHELTRADHLQLLQFVTACQGMVILSGYDHPLYRAHLAGWQRVTRRLACPIAHAHQRRRGGERTEVIWVKPNATRQLTLWDGHWEGASV